MKMVAPTDASEIAAAPRRKPFYRDLSFQVLVGMVLGVAFGALVPGWGAAMKRSATLSSSSSRW